MEQMKRHPLSAVWGDLPREEFLKLKKSIKYDGMLEKIVVQDSFILDGYNRYLACLELGIESPEMVSLAEQQPGMNAEDYVIARNATRRHLTPSQRAQAVIWIRTQQNRIYGDDSTEPEPLRNLEQVLGPDPDSKPEPTNQELADEADVSLSLIKQAKTAEEAGLGDAVRSGEMSAGAAAKQAKSQDTRPKVPTVTEGMQETINELQDTLQERNVIIAMMEQEIEFLRSEAKPSEEREALFKRQDAEIHALKSNLSTLQERYDEVSAKHRGAQYYIKTLKEQLREHGVEID